jgi:hypothetical protein
VTGLGIEAEVLTMKLTVNTYHLALIDRVVETGILGKSRGDVLKGAVIEHVRFLLAGGTSNCASTDARPPAIK